MGMGHHCYSTFFHGIVVKNPTLFCLLVSNRLNNWLLSYPTHICHNIQKMSIHEFENTWLQGVMVYGTMCFWAIRYYCSKWGFICILPCHSWQNKWPWKVPLCDWYRLINISHFVFAFQIVIFKHHVHIPSNLWYKRHLSVLLLLYLHSQLNTWFHWIGRRQLQDETRNHI